MAFPHDHSSLIGYITIHDFTLLLVILLLATAEPRGGSQDDFESVLNSYYDAIHGARKPLSGRKKRAKEFDVSNQCADNTNPGGGAALFAVCRGKVCISFILYKSCICQSKNRAEYGIH